MEIYKSVRHYFSTLLHLIDRRFNLFILLVLIVSWGQMLFMYVWKDDNAIFFKFTHLAEPAGYLGRGLWGEGPYKLSVAPYWFVYKLFGYDSTFPFYLFALVFYVLATVCVYFFVKKVFTRREAQVASFLFASGYIASEGFYWLASSWILSVSIFLTLLFVCFYYLFVTKSLYRYYWLGLLFYFLSVFLTPVRVHYTIALVVLLEILFRVRFKVGSILSMIGRVSPFFVIFYTNYVVSADSRTATLGELFAELFKGNLYMLYSFFGTVGNMIIPDKGWNIIFNLFTKIRLPQSLLYLVISIVGVSLLVFFLNIKRKIGYAVYGLFMAATVIWYFLSYKISHYPQVSSAGGAPIIIFAGGVFLLLILFLTLLQVQGRKHLIFFYLWFLMSMFVYTAYIPTSVYATIDRYLGHTFIALISLLITLSYILHRYKTKQRAQIFITILILWGSANMYFSFINQSAVVKNISNPAKNFYDDLKVQLPTISKDQVIYIDIASDSRSAYSAAFSVGQMPETTALAWRYNLDRYDFTLVNTYEDFVKNRTSNQLFSSFVFKNQKLINTTNDMQALSDKEITISDWNLTEVKNENAYLIELTDPISSLLPVNIELVLSTSPKKIVSNTNSNTKSIFNEGIDYIAAYQKYTQKARYTSSSEWQERKLSNISDNNRDTAWQPDRILWHEMKESVTIDLNGKETIDRIAMINGFEQNSPTEFTIQHSQDGKAWESVYEYKNNQRLTSNVIYEFSFSPVLTRYLRVIFKQSLNDDSPGITELWAIPATFKGISATELERFRNTPFGSIQNDDQLSQYLRSVNNIVGVSYSWLKDDDRIYQTSGTAISTLNAQSSNARLNISIPAGGLKTYSIKLQSFSVPLEVTIKSVKLHYSKLSNEK